MAIAAIAMVTAATETQANFAWITNTNGIVWKRDISYSFRTLSFGESDKSKVAQIVVPENTDINHIFVTDCINLTNIVIQTNNPIEVSMRNTRLQNITVRPGMEWKVWLVIDSKDTRIPLGPPRNQNNIRRTAENGNPNIPRRPRTGCASNLESRRAASVGNRQWRMERCRRKQPMEFPVGIRKDKAILQTETSRSGGRACG